MKSIKKENRKGLLGLLISVIIIMAVVWAVYPQGSISESAYYPGTQTETDSYVLFREGANYYAKNGSTGAIDYSGSNFTDVFMSCALDLVGGTPVANKGGSIFLRAGTYEYTAGLNVLLQEAPNTPRPFKLHGEGESSVLKFTGTGYALTINSTWTPYQWVKLENFKITGDVRTTGRHGIYILRIGRRAVIDHLKITSFDVGLTLGVGVNAFATYNTRITSVNTGIQTVDASVNELSFITTDVISSYEYGALIQGGSQIALDYCTWAPQSGYGLVLNGSWLGSRITCNRFEPAGYVNYSLFISPGYYSCQGLSIEACYWSSGNKGNYAIGISGGRDIHIDSPTSRNHNISFICLTTNSYTDLLITNPRIMDPYLIDNGVSITSFQNRIAGRVVEPRRTGLIVRIDQNVTEGDIVKQSANKGIWTTTTTANDDLASPVMWDNIDATKLGVICTSGITRVNNASIFTMGDTVVSHTVATQCTVNNAQTDPKIIIGYVCAVSGDLGQNYAFARILDK